MINFVLKMSVKIILRIKLKNHVADPEKGFLKKSISKAYGRATAMPPVWDSTTCEGLILILRRPTCQSWHIKPFYPCKARIKTNKQTRYFSALTAERELLAALLCQNDEKIHASFKEIF